MSLTQRQRAVMEIERRSLIERGIMLDNVTRFMRRLARLATLLPPGEAPNFAERLNKYELRDWVETQTEFRIWLY